MATPQAGWTVAGFRYYMHDPPMARLSFIYLANDPSHTQHSVQFWWAIGRCQPTEYHGDWRELADGSLWMSFNGRNGPARWYRLHTHHLWRIQERPLVYEGFDYQGRRIRMEHYGTYEVCQDGTMAEVGQDDFVIVQELADVPQLP